MAGVINNINKAHWLTGKVYSGTKQRLISSLKYIYALCCNKSNGRLQKKVYCQMYQQLNGIVQVLVLHQHLYGVLLKYVQMLRHKYKHEVLYLKYTKSALHPDLSSVSYSLLGFGCGGSWLQTTPVHAEDHVLMKPPELHHLLIGSQSIHSLGSWT